MALPSQTDRQSELGRSYVYKNRPPRSTGQLVLIGLGITLLGVGALWGLTSLLSPSKPSISPPTPTGGKSGEVAGTPGKGTAGKGTTGGALAGAGKVTEAKPNPPIAIHQGSGTSTPNKSGAIGAADPAGDKPQTASTQPTGTPPTNPPQSPSGTPTSSNPAPTHTPSSLDAKPTPVDVTNPSGVPRPSNPTSSSPGVTPGPTGSPGPTTPVAPTGSTEEVRQLISEGDRQLQRGDLLGARVAFSRALLHPKAARADQDSLRGKLGAINQDLVFSAKVIPGDPIAEEYTVQPGDMLARIARERELATDWRLIQRINKVEPSRLRVGQKLKLVRGPFHAVVTKSDYRLDLFWGSPDDPDNWLYIKSFRVGLGAGNGTPTGAFVIKPKSKLINPPWVNPQTGEKFGADDPKNPIGEHWLGFEGQGESAKFKGFGLHGTIEPGSIGQQQSMGCVRLAADDIAIVYEMLAEGLSTVRVVP